MRTLSTENHETDRRILEYIRDEIERVSRRWPERTLSVQGQAKSSEIPVKTVEICERDTATDMMVPSPASRR